MCEFYMTPGSYVWVWSVLDGIIQDEGDNKPLVYRSGQEWADNMDKHVGESWVAIDTRGNYARVMERRFVGHETVFCAPMPWASEQEKE